MLGGAIKRDLDLIRKILFILEEAPGWAPPLEIDGYSDEELDYHAYLVMDAGLAKGAEFTGLGDSGPTARLTHLTWQGHEFLEAARDETRWKKAKDLVKEKTGGITLDLLKTLLTSLMKRALEIS